MKKSVTKILATSQSRLDAKPLCINYNLKTTKSNAEKKRNEEAIVPGHTTLTIDNWTILE